MVTALKLAKEKRQVHDATKGKSLTIAELKESLEING